MVTVAVAFDFAAAAVMVVMVVMAAAAAAVMLRSLYLLQQLRFLLYTE